MAGSYTRRINLYINGKEVKNNIASIRAEMNKLINEQSRMTRGSREYVDAGKKIRIMDGILQQHREQIKSVSKAWSFENLSNSMNKYFLAISTFAAGFSGLLYSGKKAITMFAEFDDIVANVKRTTGIATEDVYAMNESLKKVNTRTAQENLMGLGVIAGKLGIAKEEVEGFIKAADKINVALSGALGPDTEEAINQIGKLVAIFNIGDKFGIEKGMLKVGSAINSLGLASTANEGYLVEFAKRVGGVAPTANISIQSVLGLAATLDQLGQTSEVSSTVYSQVITGMFKKTGEYAKIAGMETKKFASLLKKDANEAFIKVMEGLRGNNEGMERLVGLMGDLGLDGKRAVTVLGVLSNNTGMLREQQDMANKSFSEGNSILDAFNTRNNSAQAILEKKRKALNNMAIDLGQKLMPVLTASTSGFTYFVKVVTVLTDFFIRHSATIITLTASIVAYTIATKLATLWQNRQTQATLAQIIVTKAKAIVEAAAIAVTQLYAAATMRLAGNIKGATQAMRVFSATVKASPIGLLIGALTLAAGALFVYWQKTKEVVREGVSLTKETIELQKQKSDLIVQEKNELNNLVRQLLLTNEKSTIRKNLLAELQKLYPDFLGNLKAEKVTNQELATQLGIVNQSYEEKLRLAAMSAKSEALTRKMTDNEVRKLDIETELDAKRKVAITPGTELDKEIKSLEAEYNTLTNQNKGYYLTLKDLDKNIVQVKESSFSNTVEWWTKKTDELNFSISATKENIKRANEQNDKASAEHYAKALANYEAEKKIAESQLIAAQKKAKEDSANGKPGDGDGYEPVIKPTGTISKWSLNNEIMFLKESLKLKQDYNAGVIKTQEDLDAQLRKLEIKFLKERILSGKEKGNDLLDLQNQLAEKQIEFKKDSQKREESLQDEINKGKSPIEKEKQEFEDRLIELRLYGKNRKNMTAIELAAIEALEKEHKQKLAKLDADAMKDELESRQRTYETSLAELQLHHADELNSITSLDQAKQILSATMSNEELQKIRSLEKAKTLIKKQSDLEEQEFTRKHLEDLLQILQGVMGSGEWKGLDLSDNVLSEKEKQILVDRINEVKKILSGLTAGPDDQDPKVAKLGGLSTDILGFSQDDWDILYKNLEDGKIGIDTLIMGVKALSEIWKSYYESVSKYEQAKLEQFEQGVNNQKETLQESLEGNLISQEAYNYQVAQLDEELDRRKADLEYKNAVRARNMAIMEAIVNTATAVTSALKVKPPLGIVLAAIVGGLGAFQIGKIMATPLPGKEDGGFIDVQRTQDGKVFKARNNPKKRGYVSTPTVITGEKPGSSEYIVSDAGVSNPTVRPILDVLEMARMNGNLSTINLPAILESTHTYPGRQKGGYITEATGNVSGRNQNMPGVSQDPVLLEIILQNTRVMASLKSRLDKPIESKVALRGRGGLYEVMDEDAQLTNNSNL